ncbi:MAG: long-chain fatty acid--CoA ligase [Chloroflexi bacterium]|nr:long-chain fatty acid--CoA ligase [Chloroflexota bacterium]
MHAADLLSARARLTPEREALLYTHTGERFTYAQLNARANRAANFLRARFGVRKGDRVSLYANNSVIFVDLFYGLAKLGAIFAPLNWRLTARELAYIVGDCEPKVVLCGPEFVPTLNEICAHLKVPHLVGVEGAQMDDAPAYEDEIARASDAEPERPPLSDDDPYCILYTSGTTGRPKGALLPHRQVLWNCINTVVSWGLNENDVSPVLTPLFHAGGLFAFLTPLFYAGGRIILARAFDAEESLQRIVAEKCSVELGVPTLFQLWHNTPHFRQADFSHVRFWINGGAAIPVPLMEAWLAAKGGVFRQGYGLTEVGPNCFSMTDEESARKRGSLGKPIFHSQMRLVNPATGEDVPVGQPGELLIRGPHVCAGYWRNPQATADALTAGWFHTGDGMRMDDDGFFYFVGRFKDMIKSGGENIYAAEVEKIFRDHPAVADAALIGQPDEQWGEVGLMIVLLQPGRTATPDELLAFCQGKLARYKIPKRVIFADAFPYSPYGKVEKAKLREKYLP